MRRRVLLGVVLAVLVLAAGAIALSVSLRQRTPILVGLLHSQTGPWATVERSMLEAELLAIEDLNANGGLLGRPVRAVVADGRSDARTFAYQADRLINEVKVSVLIGCWTTEARKAVRSVVEEANHLLIYPPAYEGLEQSPNIIYVGGPTNQQLIPAMSWCRDARKARKFFLIGSESVMTRALGAVIKDQLRAIKAELVGEVYLNRGDGGGSRGEESSTRRNDVNEAVAQIARAAPDVVLSTVDAADSLAFYGRMRHAGLGPEKLPVVSFSLDEEVIRRTAISDVVGQFAAWNYVESIDRPANSEFRSRVRRKFGPGRVISDNFQIAYQSVLVWAETVDDVKTDDVQAVNRQMLRQSVKAPEGIITIDFETRHGWRPFYLGKVLPNGQFEVVWSISKSIRPIPYPATRSPAEWDTMVAELMAGSDREIVSRSRRP